MFRRLLVANRGEIAVRVIRACRALGVRSVAVYSEADRLSPHVLLADEAVLVGPAEAAQSYLNIESLLEAARRTAADAVHPGYGFLAENPDFARAVEEAGLAFVGPPAAAMEAMGDKTAARERMEEAGVPVVPGSAGVVPDVEAALTAAENTGYPVMLKAAAGGGGKGMRIARDPAELRAAFPRAESEARQGFGDGRLYVERFLSRPRHVEIQVLADAHGTIIHLGERECSIQRRHQKLVEESPSPAVDASLRERMGEVAVRAAEAVGYLGAGTVEFLLDEGAFYFLEMNTRIQVEHPVTEMVTGQDLVAEQVRIAAGEPISFVPDPSWPHGHAMEFRISAEDPYHGFLPSTGRIQWLRPPAGPGVRWDSGVVQGFEVGLHYDSLMAKLIVHGANREQAIARAQQALSELRITGVSTTQPLHLGILEERDFRAGRLSVRYLEEHPELTDAKRPPEWLDLACVAAALLEEERRQGVRSLPGAGSDARPSPRRPSLWQQMDFPRDGADFREPSRW